MWKAKGVLAPPILKLEPSNNFFIISWSAAIQHYAYKLRA